MKNPKDLLFKTASKLVEGSYHDDSIERILFSKSDNDDYEKHETDVNKLHGELRELHNHQDKDGAVGTYTHRSRNLNEALINKYHLSKEDLSDYSSTIAGLNKHIDTAAPLKEELHTYSGTGYWRPKFNKEGEIHFPAFTSTTTKASIATAFMKHSSHIEGTQSHVIHFTLPKGYSEGAYIAHHSDIPREREYLLRDGQTFKKTGETVSELGTHKTVIHHVVPVEHVTEALVHRPELIKVGNKSIKKSYTLSDEIERVQSIDRDINHDHHLALIDRADESYRKHKNNNTIYRPHNKRQRSDVDKHLHGYTEYSSGINERLLKSRKLNGRAKAISASLKKVSAPLEHETHVYSGMKSFNPSKHFEAGNGVIHMPTFVSTTIHPSFASNWGARDGRDEHHIIHFILPKGYDKGGYIQHHSDYPHEHEFLLQPKQKWRLVKHEVIHDSGIKTHDETWEDTPYTLKKHVWSVVPARGKFAVKEAYEHDSEAVKNHSFSTPAIRRISEDHYKEHNELARLHAFNNEAHRKAAEAYTASSVGINKTLIANEPLHLYYKSVHEKMMDGFDHVAPLENEHHVYTATKSFDPRTVVGNSGVFKTPAYTSTSINPKIAAGHANLHRMLSGDEHDHVIHFTLPKGYKGGRYVGHVSQYAGETEMILRPNQRFKMVGYEEHKLPNGTTRHIHHAVPLDHIDGGLHEAAFHSPQFFKHAGWVSEGDSANSKRVKTATRDIRSYVDAASIAEYEKHSSDTLKHKSETLQSLDHYIGAGSKVINAHLLKKHVEEQGVKLNGNFKVDQFAPVGDHETKKTENHIASIKHTINTSRPLDKTTHVYSGLSYNPSKHFESNAGVIHTPAFTSTSFSPDVSRSFRTRETDENENIHNHVIHFELPKGYSRGVAPPYNTGEREYILDSGQKWKLTGHKRVVTNKTILGKTLFTHIWSVKPHEDIVKERYDPLKAWTNNSRNVNKALATGSLTRGLKARATRMSNLMGTHEGEHLTVFHGTKDRGFAVGQSHTPKTFLSASTDRDVAERFAKAHAIEANSSDAHVVALRIHPGVKLLHIGNEKSAYDEHEVVLHHNQPFQIERHEVYQSVHPVTKAHMNVHVWHASVKAPLKEAYEHDPDFSLKTTKHLEDLQGGDTSDWLKHHEDEHNHLAKLHDFDTRNDHRAHEHLKAIGNYTNDSNEFNSPILDGGEKHYLHDHLESALTNTPKLTRDHHVYSSVGKFDPGSVLNGSHTFVTKPFISTSINPEIAATHHNEKAENATESHLIHFHLPKGYDQGRYIAKHSEFPDEGEFLLKPNQKWHVTGVTQHDHPKGKIGRTVHVWHVIPHDPSLHEAFKHNEKYNFNSTKPKLDPIIDHEDTSYLMKGYRREHEHLLKYHTLKDQDHEIAVRKYTSDYSSIINEKLIRKEESSISDYYIKHLKKATNEAPPLQREHHVYSSTGSFDPTKVMNRGVFRTPAFTSASIHPEVATAHANAVQHQRHMPNGRHIIHFTLPKGYTKARYVAGHSEYPSELEMLLHPNEKWKVTGSTKQGETTIWHVEPHEPKKKAITETTVPRIDVFNSTVTVPFGDAPPKIQGEHPVHKGFLDTHDKQPELKADIDKQHVELHRHHASQISGSGHKIAQDYAKNSSSLNEHLVGKKSAGFLWNRKFAADTLSKHIQEHAKPFKSDVHTYSGLGGFDPTEHFKDGVIHMKAFTSSSLDPLISTSFIPSKNSAENPAHIIHFHLPKGYSRGLYLEGHASKLHEHEVLLDKEQKWKLVGTHQTVMNVNHFDRSHRKPHHIKIWSVVPHDENLHETTFHTKNFFRSVNVTPKSAGKGSYDDSNKLTTLGRYKDKLMNVRDSGHTDMVKQHVQLVGKHSSLRHDNTIGMSHLRNYTASSRLLNNTLIKQHAADKLGVDVHIHHNHQDYDQETHEEQLEIAGHLSKMIEVHGSPLEGETHVYSGLKRYVPNVKVGDVFETPAFTSSSIDPTQAMDFTRSTLKDKEDYMKGGRRHLLHFKLPVGYKKGVYVDHISQNSGEHEYILDKGQKWKVTKHEKVMNNRYSTEHTHIWTVEPYDESLKEAYTHDTKYTYKSKHEYEALEGNVESNARYHDEHIHLSQLHHFPSHKIETEGDSWSGSGSANINHALVHNEPIPSDSKELFDNMHELIHTAAPLEHEHHVYSSMGPFNPSKLFNEHKHFTTPAFISSSLNPEVAAIHSKNNQQDSHILHIKLPKGYSKGRYIAHASGYPSEREFVLAPNQTFKVLGRKKIGPRHIWSIEPHED